MKNLIQDIYPKQFNIEYKNRIALSEDKVVIFEDSDIFVYSDSEGKIGFPSVKDFLDLQGVQNSLMYLFSVDEDHYYLHTGDLENVRDDQLKKLNKRELFNGFEDVYGMIVFTAAHIHEWYMTNRYCGRCGAGMTLRADERTMTCSSCELTKYPQINPVVIVGVHDGDKILLTKYANTSYDRYALVAGFVEVGESFEDAVRREVMEEVGLKVRNIEYFASQPWGITGGILAGYFAELDGDSTIKLDYEELKEGSWLTKDEMPEVFENEKSLTRTMMYDWWSRQG